MPTLSGRYYTDPEVFAAEQDAIFSAVWVAAARTADIVQAGQWRVVQVGRESVIVARGTDGELRAFLNVCRHRGSRLCTAESGTAKRAFQCGYHAWTYGLDGRLIAAPNLTSMPDVDRAAHGLVPVPLREWVGYVWLCLAPEPPDFGESVVAQVTERLGDPDAVDAWSIGELALGRRITYDVAANWKLIVENFMECYHCATIHPELTDVLPEFRQGYAAQYYVGHGAEFGTDVAGFTVDGRSGFDRLTGLDDEKDRRYYAITIRPQVFVNLVPDHVIFHRLVPLAPDRTIVECDWLYDPSVVSSGADIDSSVELFHRVNSQDFEACERCQPAMASRAYVGGGVMVPTEHHIGLFHHWVRARLGEVLA
ncbi:MAG: aromatic ring-hydroxylating oxygenase subunit alpha [Acidimicrobiales bacterium]